MLIHIHERALFAWLISRTFSANEHYFSLTINQPTVLSAMAYHPSEQGIGCGIGSEPESRDSLDLFTG